MATAGPKRQPIAPLALSAEERSYLERQVRRHRVARSLSERCRIILRCADGLTSKSIAEEFGLHQRTVGKWRRRFLKDRCDGLLDEAHPGRPCTIDDDRVAAVIDPRRPTRRTRRCVRWRRRQAFPIPRSGRMWTAFALQSHRSQTFMLSGGPPFVDKRRDIVGRWFSAADEKSQTQALDREQPVLPMMPGIHEGGRTTTCGTERPLCSPPSISSRARQVLQTPSGR